MPDFNRIAAVVCAIAAAGAAQEQEWVARYNGPVNGTDVSYDMVVDNDGNVYLTGFSDGDGTREDWLTVKYDPAGNELWTARHDGPAHGSDRAWALAVDASSNVYVTGETTADGPGSDYTTIMYDASGNERWIARYNGPGTGADVASDIVVSQAGEVYVTGVSAGQDTGRDYATIKYDGDGNQLWVARYDFFGHEDEARRIALDGAGNVYVTGASRGDGTGLDILTIRYTDAGSEVWAGRYTGDGEADDGPHAIATAGSWIYVVGSVYDSKTADDMILLRYTEDGSIRGIARYNGPDNGADAAYALVVEPDGDVIIAGDSDSDATDVDQATVKFEGSQLQQLWASRFNGPENRVDRARAIAVDSFGNSYVAGWSWGGLVYWDITTVSYDPLGGERWSARYDGPARDDDQANAIALDGSGSVVVAGASRGGESGIDYAAVKYSQPSRECRGDEKLRLDCFRRCRDGRYHVRATAKTALPPGTPLTLTLDDAEPIVVELGNRGKARVNWFDVEPGAHSVAIVECSVSRQTNCCQ